MPTKKISDLPNPQKCKNWDHEPAQHGDLEPGIYEHVCSSCGKVTRFSVGHPTEFLKNDGSVYDDESPDYIKNSIED